jgi:hypothetical protein
VLIINFHQFLFNIKTNPNESRHRKFFLELLVLNHRLAARVEKKNKKERSTNWREITQV